MLHRLPLHHQASSVSVCLLPHANMISEFRHLPVAQHHHFTAPSLSYRQASCPPSLFCQTQALLPHLTSLTPSLLCPHHAQVIYSTTSILLRLCLYVSLPHPTPVPNNLFRLLRRSTSTTATLPPSPPSFVNALTPTFEPTSLLFRRRTDSARYNSACSIDCRFTTKPLLFPSVSFLTLT